MTGGKLRADDVGVALCAPSDRKERRVGPLAT